MIQSQEKLLLEAVKFWEAEKNLRGVILDVGCGLGGSSIFLAQEYGAQVYALTNVPGHIKYISQFSRQAGVADKVVPILGDAYEVPGSQVFDAAVAIDSSCYFDRRAWFHHLANRVRPGGHVFIADCFARSDEVREPFDGYWLTHIGTLNEYHSAAETEGFNLEGMLDLTSRTALFWDFSVLHSRRLLETFMIPEQESKRLRKSIKWQTRLLSMWNDEKIMCALLQFKHLE